MFLKMVSIFKSMQVLNLHFKHQLSTSVEAFDVGSKLYKGLTSSKVIDDDSATVILFPGQGTQYVGMARDLIRFPKARRMFEISSETLKYDLLKLCLEGPAQKLEQTKYSQLAVMTSSLAAIEQLREECPHAVQNCIATAGFSLGELTALVFAGSLTFDIALHLVQIRAEAMQIVCDSVNSGMALVVYTPETKLNIVFAKAVQWCLDQGIEAPYCGVANYMYPHCKVVAGNLVALKYLEANARELKIRTKRIPVSGAFHTPLMEPAAQKFKTALSKISIRDPIISVYSNVDGKPYRNAHHIYNQLPKQITRPVKWEQTMHEIYQDFKDNFPKTYECGPGESGLIKILEKVNAKAANKAYCVKA